jgi:hypothetical protein
MLSMKVDNDTIWNDFIKLERVKDSIDSKVRSSKKNKKKR